MNTAGTQSTSGNAGTATALETARTIGGVSFDGSANIDLPGVNAAGNQNTTGSAATLTTARTIGGVSFDGSANIDLPGVNTAGTQSTSGNAGTATALETARTIGGVLFDGSADIDLPGFILEDGGGTEVTITENKEIKFVEGGGIDINWTDVSPGSDSDPYDLTFSLIAATSDALGGVKIGYSKNGQNYPIKLDGSSKMFVNVPCTDTNSTYSAGNGITLTGTTFSANVDDTRIEYDTNGKI